MRFKFLFEIEHDGTWDSGTPMELLEELKKLVESDHRLVGGAKITQAHYTPYPDEPWLWRDMGTMGDVCVDKEQTLQAVRDAYNANPFKEQTKEDAAYDLGILYFVRIYEGKF